MNISPGALPEPSKLRYPAISIEGALGRSVDRWLVLADTIRAMQVLRLYITRDEFIERWNSRLAFKDTWVWFKIPGKEAQEMQVRGVNDSGKLLLEDLLGDTHEVVQGEIVMA